MSSKVFLLFIFSCSCFTFCLNTRDTYDFIIVGGGTAGSVLATRLSEISSWKILLLEAGACGNILNQVPAAAAKYKGTSLDWHYEIEPQRNCCLGLKDGKLFWSAGKLLGGSSEINYMIYTRGNRKDFDLWSKNGNPGWSYKDVLPYFLKSEKYRFRKFSSKYHSKTGLMNVEHTYRSNLTGIFLGTAKQLGYDILDYNGGRQTRFSKIKAHLRKGGRHSVFKAFLEPVQSRRYNLTVICSATVTKVMAKGNNSATGVVYIQGDKKKRAYSRKELVLSAGVVGSTKLLLLSGIGPKDDLQNLQIPLVRNLPVGQNIRDHISYFGLNYLTNLQLNFDHLGYITGIYSCSKPKKCIASSPAGIEAIGFIKANDTGGNYNVPDVEILLVNHLITRDLKSLTNMKDEVHQKLFQGAEEFIGANIFPILLHPQSKGFIKLRSKKPLQDPIIQPNYLSQKEDLIKMVSAIKFVEKMITSDKFRNADTALYPVPVCDEFEIYSEQYWECAVKTLTMSFNDYMGGCKMGPSSDHEAVVDNKLQVHGMKKLMVVDASVIPVTISGHIGAATVMIAEKAADIIKEKHLKVV